MLQKIVVVSFIATLLFGVFYQINTGMDPVAETRIETSPIPEIRPESESAAQFEQAVPNDRTTDISLTSQQGLFIEESEWSQEELATVQQIFDHTVNALKEVGLDGRQILDRYRFRRYRGEYVNDVEGALAVIDHEKMEIVLADTAFLRHQGFNIYHELGHAVDYRLERQLSQGYHQIAGPSQEKTDGSWTTADGYWLRFHSRDDREEATADAFALWVITGQTDLGNPVFYGTPTTVNYDGITEAISSSLFDMAL